MELNWGITKKTTIVTYSFRNESSFKYFRRECLYPSRRHLRVHLFDGRCSSIGFCLLHVPGPEEELSVEVALFNEVHVGDHDLAPVTGTDAHHRKVFKKFTTDGASSDDEVF